MIHWRWLLETTMKQAVFHVASFFDDGDDLLGKAIITSDQIHPNGFCGEVHLTHAGRRHKHAAVVMKIELLSKDIREETGMAADSKVGILGTQVEEIIKDVEGVAEEIGKEVDETVTAATVAVEHLAFAMDIAVEKPLASKVFTNEFAALSYVIVQPARPPPILQ